MTTTTTTDDAVQIPQLGRYAIDRRASTVTFRSRHLFGLAPVHGTRYPSMRFTSRRLDRSEGRWTLAGRHLDVSLRILGVRG
jgi:hypothetical protein